jgi:predicted nucleic-acid-binding Zn-ribbon protein
MKDAPCPKCGSREIIYDAEVRDYDSSSYRRLSVYVALKKPEGGFFKKTNESGELVASVCGACGYTELYATNHQAMLRASKL